MTTVLAVIVSLADIALVAFAGYALWWSRRTKNDLEVLRRMIMRQLAIVSAMNIQQTYIQIEKLHSALQQCASTEQFEEAERLKKMIEERKAQAAQQLKDFNEMFGGVAEISSEEIRINEP